MNNKSIWIFLGCSLLAAGCNSVVLVRDDVGGGIPRLTNAQINSAGILTAKDYVYITFVGNCPQAAFPLLSQCSEPLGSSVCRKQNEMVKFKSIPDSSTPNPSFGIEFETMPQFNPCTQSNLDNQTPGVKNCTIKTQPDWPGQGEADLIIKYTVTTPSGTCDLDPYLVLRR